MVKQLTILLVLVFLVSCGQNEPLVNYEPKSAQEQALKQVLLTFEESVKQKNPQKLADLLHVTASVMVGRERQMLGKDAYLKILAQRLQDNTAVSLGQPKMKIYGDMAEVKIYMQRGNNNTLVVFDLIREDEQWYIQSWKY